MSISSLVPTLTRKTVVATAQDNNLCTPLELAIIFGRIETANLILDKCHMTEEDLKVPFTAAVLFGRLALVDKIENMVGEKLIRDLLERAKKVRATVRPLAADPKDLPEFLAHVLTGASHETPRTKFYVHKLAMMNHGNELRVPYSIITRAIDYFKVSLSMRKGEPVFKALAAELPFNQSI